MSYTYSGVAVIPSDKFSSGIDVTLPDSGFPDSNYSVSVTPTAFEKVGVFVSIYDGERFWIGGSPGTYQWIATNKNGSNGVYQGSYYKTTAQTLTSGNTDITFDGTGAWNNTGGYITHVNGTKDFTVVQTGLYQLEFNSTVLANGATWTTTVNRTVGIDITKGTESTIITNSGLQASGQNYAQSVNATYYLEAGDVINMRVGNTFTGGPPSVVALSGFDLNTFFTWRFIS